MLCEKEVYKDESISYWYVLHPLPCQLQLLVLICYYITAQDGNTKQDITHERKLVDHCGLTCTMSCSCIHYYLQAKQNDKADVPMANFSTPVRTLLARLGRKLYSILGDGNCFFRALSYIWNRRSSHVSSSYYCIIQ